MGGVDLGPKVTGVEDRADLLMNSRPGGGLKGATVAGERGKGIGFHGGELSSDIDEVAVGAIEDVDEITSGVRALGDEEDVVGKDAR